MHRAKGSRAERVRTTARGGRRAAAVSIVLSGFLAAACGDKTPPPNPPCERECQDAVALRAVREMMKFAFNMTLQAKPVGYNDETTDRFLHGTARVYGTAFANGEQGVTDVCLTYVFTQALYAKKEDEPDENYVMGLDGIITQEGKIAVQPSAPTALKMRSRSLRIGGKVYDPPIDYLDVGHTLEMLQNGNSISGIFCDRGDGGPDEDGGGSDDAGGGPDEDGGGSDDAGGGPCEHGGAGDADAGGPNWDGGAFDTARCRLVGFSF